MLWQKAREYFPLGESNAYRDARPGLDLGTDCLHKSRYACHSCRARDHSSGTFQTDDEGCDKGAFTR